MVGWDSPTSFDGRTFRPVFGAGKHPGECFADLVEDLFRHLARSVAKVRSQYGSHFAAAEGSRFRQDTGCQEHLVGPSAQVGRTRHDQHLVESAIHAVG